MAPRINFVCQSKVPVITKGILAQPLLKSRQLTNIYNASLINHVMEESLHFIVLFVRTQPRAETNLKILEIFVSIAYFDYAVFRSCQKCNAFCSLIRPASPSKSLSMPIALHVLQCNFPCWSTWDHFCRLHAYIGFLAAFFVAHIW